MSKNIFDLVKEKRSEKLGELIGRTVKYVLFYFAWNYIAPTFGLLSFRNFWHYTVAFSAFYWGIDFMGSAWREMK